MAEQRSDFLNELEGGTVNFTDKELARLERYMKRRGRAASPATAARIEMHLPGSPLSVCSCLRLSQS